MKILIVDDSKAVHAFVKGLLSGKNIELQHAHNGREGLDRIQESETPFDVVLLDWEMPVLTGPETLEQIKKLPHSPPVIMMTSKNAPEDIEQMISAGASEYIMKPFTPDILINRLSEVCGIEVS